MKSYEFLYFAESIGISLSDKYTYKLDDSATQIKKSWATTVGTDALKTASKRASSKQQKKLAI